jgi:hypothetical protein
MAITQIGGLNIDSDSDITVDTLLASEFITGPRYRINQSVTDEATDSQIFSSNATGDDQSSIALNIASGKSTGTAHPGSINFKLSDAGTAGNTGNDYQIKGTFQANQTVQAVTTQNVFALLNSTALVVRSDASTDVFSVKGDTGNTLIAGNLEVDGTLQIDGASTTLNSTLTVSGTNAVDLGGGSITIGTGTVTIDSTVFPRKKTNTVTAGATLALNTVTYVNQSAAISLTLPTANAGDWVYVVGNDTTSYNNITLTGTVFGDSGGLILDTTFGTAQLVYLNATVGWVAINT